MAGAVIAGVAESGGAAVDRGTGEIAAAIDNRRTAVAPQRLALRMIGEAARDLQFGIEGEQHRKPGRMDRIDVLVLAAVPPHPTETFVSPAANAAEHHRRRVMQEATKGAAAEAIVFTGIENELVPEVI